MIQTGLIEAFTVNGKPVHRLATNERSAGGGWLTDAGYQSVFPSGPGDPLRLSDIDLGVAQINRLRRNQASVQVLPGQAVGDSVIAISNVPGDRTYYTLGVDNYGAESTGVTRYRAGVEADNLIGLQESLSLNYIDSLESNALVGSFAIPWGRNTFTRIGIGPDRLARRGFRSTSVRPSVALSHIDVSGPQTPWLR